MNTPAVVFRSASNVSTYDPQVKRNCRAASFCYENRTPNTITFTGRWTVAIFRPL
jgi:hypothetical protein